MEQVHKHQGKSSEALLDKRVILESLKISPSQRILDAGCGDGYMSREFSRLIGNSGKVYAVDMHKESINQLSKETKGSNIVTIVSDITQKTEIKDSSIDLIYLSTVFHGFTRLQKDGFLKEAKRILKPGGVLAVVEINKSDTPFGPPMDIRYSPEELVEAVGLDELDLTKIGEYFYMQTFVYNN